MFVCIMKIELRFHVVSSIKEKRNIVNSVKNKLAAHFKLSVAEVDDIDLYNSSILGLTFVSLKKDHCITKSQKIIEFLEKNNSDVFFDYDRVVEEY
ncbi:MAG: hypothetical protein A2086_16660 [Spirochaetes bacterium GWD1_27_9]|nr:MAG: hypothetical protein A2086_16660 [Spirochaetes bacterium GWD1_27_9]